MEVTIIVTIIFVLKIILLLAYLLYRHRRYKRKREEQIIRENRSIQQNGRALCVFVDSPDSPITSTDLIDPNCDKISENYEKPPSYDTLFPT